MGLTQIVHGLAVDPSGAAAITGSFYDTVDFGQGLLETAGDSDMFLPRVLAP